MPTYTPVNVTAQNYRRSHGVIIKHEYNQHPQITYLEQDILLDGDNAYTNRVGELTGTMTPENMLTEFPLLDPSTGKPTGETARYLDLQVLLFSLYFSLAATRDAQSAAPKD